MRNSEPECGGVERRRDGSAFRRLNSFRNEFTEWHEIRASGGVGSEIENDRRRQVTTDEDVFAERATTHSVAAECWVFRSRRGSREIAANRVDRSRPLQAAD